MTISEQNIKYSNEVIDLLKKLQKERDKIYHDMTMKIQALPTLLNFDNSIRVDKTMGGYWFYYFDGDLRYNNEYKLIAEKAKIPVEEFKKQMIKFGAVYYKPGDRMYFEDEQKAENALTWLLTYGVMERLCER